MKNKTINKDNNIRFKILIYIIVVVFIIITIKLYSLTIIESSIYKENLKHLTSSIVYGDTAPRGRIYDRNHKLLVDNKSIPVILYKKQKKITKNEEIELAYKIADIIDVDFSKLALINLKEFWIDQNKTLANAKITEEEWEKLKNRKLNQDDIKNLKLDRITEEELSTYTSIDKEAAYIYYLMNKGYSYQEKVIKDENITDKEYAYIAEHSSELNGFDVSYRWERVYLYGDTFRDILGNISSITAENKNEFLKKGYSLDDIVGVSYLEKQYEDILKGTKATYKLENGKLNLISEAKRGNDIVLTIDIELQREIENILEEEVIRTKKEGNTTYYNKSYVVIQQPNTGEILAMSGKQVVVNGKEYKTYDVTPGIVTNPMTPGSVVKGASILVGYHTGAINMGEYMNDSCIKIYMKPRKCSWSKLGRINDIDALAYSSNIYQFKTAMKVDEYKYTYNGKWNAKKSTFDIYRNIFHQFGLGVKTGIDLPIESVGNIGTNYSSDLLLNFAIGQYDTYTPMQLSQYITTYASNGNRYQPHLLKAVYEESGGNELGNLLYEVEPVILNKVDVKDEYIKRVQQGLRAVLTYGLGKNIMGDSPTPSGKTGTSESFLDTDGDGKVDTETLSNAYVGYAPSDEPVMSITVTSPDLVDPNGKSSSRSYLNHRLTRMISNKFFELYNKTN